MSGIEGMYLDRAAVAQYGADLEQLMPAMQRRSVELHTALSSKIAEAGGSCEVVWPPDGPYRAHYAISKSSLDPDGTGFNVTENRDLHHLYADRPARVGVSEGRFATRWLSGELEDVRPLMLDEVSRLAVRIMDGRIVQPNEIAQDGRVYKRNSLRYSAHIIAKRVFGADF